MGCNWFDKKDATPEEPKKSKTPTWLIFARKYEGKKETDPEFDKFMASKWFLVGLKSKTIQGSTWAWCGLAIAVALSGVGLDHARNGALARNWASYGQEINWKVDGIPEGAIVQINHVKCGNGSSNHVSMANGDCAASDLLKSGATLTLYGGNQNNTWKKSEYSVKEVCAVRWPKESPKPGKILKSINCSAGHKSNESTR